MSFWETFCVRRNFKILSTTRHLDFVSNDCGSALLEELCDHHEVLLRRNLHKKRVTWCDEDSLPSFVASMSTRNQFILQDPMNGERTTSVKIILCPNVKNSKQYPSTQGQWVFHQNVLELLENKPRNFWNPHNTRLLSCCFLHELVEASTFLRNLVLHVSQTLSAIPALSCPSASDVRLSFILIVMTHHSCNQFGDMY